MGSTGHLRHDYLIKYAFFDKVLFRTVYDPENWTTNVG